MKKSDLKQIKTIAISFLYQPIMETEYSPLIIIHPIFESAFITIKKNNSYQLVNLLEDDNFNIAIKEYSNLINKCETVFSVYMIIRKSYKLTFLKYIKDYLSINDFSNLLAHSWVLSENPNDDTNVSIDELINWFCEADKLILMDETEYKIYRGIPETIKLYRGVAVGRNPNGLSWTDNKEKAIWFSNRFNNTKKGYLLECVFSKNDILAFFDSRNENEYVVNIKNAKQIIKIN